MSDTTLLWELLPADGKPSWLFGSMHIRDERVYQFGQQLYPLIRSADQFVGEMELDSSQPVSFPVTYDIREHLTPKAYEKLRHQLLKSFHVDISRYAKWHPLMIMSAITQSVMESEHQISLDEHLWHYAKAHDIPVSGLESFEEQFGLLHSLDTKVLYRQLVQLGKSPAGIRKQTNRALEWYMKNNIQRLYQLTKSSMHSLRKRIIYERNAIMAERIQLFDRDKTYFIVVGAGHLSGKAGLLSQLKKTGWKVKAVAMLKRKTGT